MAWNFRVMLPSSAPHLQSFYGLYISREISVMWQCCAKKKGQKYCDWELIFRTLNFNFIKTLHLNALVRFHHLLLFNFSLSLSKVSIPTHFQYYFCILSSCVMTFQLFSSLSLLFLSLIHISQTKWTIPLEYKRARA